MILSKKNLEEYIKKQSSSTLQLMTAFNVNETKLKVILDNLMKRGAIYYQLDIDTYHHIETLINKEKLYILLQSHYLPKEKITLEAGKILEKIDTIGNELLMKLPMSDLQCLLHPRQLRSYK